MVLAIFSSVDDQRHICLSERSYRRRQPKNLRICCMLPIAVQPSDVLLILIVSVFAGIVGAVFGLGGGVIIVPFLSLMYPQIPYQVVAASSIVSVVATSSASAATYVRDHVTNIRLGMFLEMSTVAGALTGAISSAYLPD